MKACLALLVIVFIGLSDACNQCYTKHPQQHYCDAHFAMQVKIIRRMAESDIDNTKLFKAKILSSWKKGPSDGKFKFYSPDVFCGSTFIEGRTYVITGSQEERDNGNHYLVHGACDFMSEWQDMSAQQKMGFRKQYKEQCDVCPTISSRRSPSDLTAELISNEFAGATTYWTPTNCYYNPHKTQQFKQRAGSDVEDCEDEHGLCVPTGSDGECQWKMTSEYKSCFKYRDNFALVDSGNFAITDETQCEVYDNRRKRQKCRKTARSNQNLRASNSRVVSL